MLKAFLCRMFGHMFFVETWNGGYVTDKCERCGVAKTKDNYR